MNLAEIEDSEDANNAHVRHEERYVTMLKNGDPREPGARSGRGEARSCTDHYYLPSEAETV